jgi:hypothetical protein
MFKMYPNAAEAEGRGAFSLDAKLTNYIWLAGLLQTPYSEHYVPTQEIQSTSSDTRGRQSIVRLASPNIAIPLNQW